jgi:hypothetical protein
MRKIITSLALVAGLLSNAQYRDCTDYNYFLGLNYTTNLKLISIEGTYVTNSQVVVGAGVTITPIVPQGVTLSYSEFSQELSDNAATYQITDQFVTGKNLLYAVVGYRLGRVTTTSRIGSVVVQPVYVVSRPATTYQSSTRNYTINITSKSLYVGGNISYNITNKVLVNLGFDNFNAVTIGTTFSIDRDYSCRRACRR